MADTWAGSWGGAWGSAWGAVAAVTPAGGGYGGTQDRTPRKSTKARTYAPPPTVVADPRRKRIAAKYEEGRRNDLAVPAEIDRRIEADGRAAPVPDGEPVDAVIAAAPKRRAGDREVVAAFAELFGPIPAARQAPPGPSPAEREAARAERLRRAEARIAARALAREEEDIEVILLLAA